MKKLFIGALALTMFTACSQDEIVEQQQLSSAITFDGAFVNNATRAADPSFTNKVGDANELKAFDVWGFVNDRTGLVFDQQRVNKTGERVWTYSPLQYWLPGNTYYFGALAPVEDKNWQLELEGKKNNTVGLGVVSFKNVNGTEDLIYAKAKVSTEGKKAGQDMPVVGLTFNHLLSKVKFSFTNGFDAKNYTINVKGIKMNVPSEGSINLAGENTWVLEQERQNTTTLEFGDLESQRLAIAQRAESAKELLTIPAGKNESYEVTFYVELYSGEVCVFKNTLATTITNSLLEMGKAYNFHATLDETNIAGDELDPIEFTVTEVAEWKDGNGYEGGLIDTEVVGLSSAEDLTAAIAKGATNFRLNTNVDESLVFTSSSTFGRSAKEYTLDLNGKKLNPATDAIVVDGGVKLTINGNGEVAPKAGTASCAVWVKHGHVVINGGTYKTFADGNGLRNDCVYVGWSEYVSDVTNKVSMVEIYGGTFSSSVKELDQYWVLNLRNEFYPTSQIKVYGGKFENFNPAANKSESEGNNFDTNFVADGYEAVKEGNDYVVYPVAISDEVELKDAIAKGGNITLNADITISETLVVKSGKVVTLNLNGHTLNNKLDNITTDVIIVEEGANLTINGEGTVEAVTGNDGYAVISEGVLTINGGTFKSGVDAKNKPNAVIYARGNGKVYVNGGSFPNDNTSKFVLNKKDADRATTVIECTGGVFYNFNPANNEAETAGTNFCAEGYTSKEVATNRFEVVKETVKE